MSIVYIVSAPSGSGKSTLVNELFKMVGNLDFSISYTTRPPRGSEQNGKEYFFITREEFEAMIMACEFLEHAEVFGNYYGTARRFLRAAEARGNDLLLDIDVQGASQVKEKISDAVSIFILPPDREKLEWRLRNRGLDSEVVIRRRLDTARREIENYSKYDYILVAARRARQLQGGAPPVIDTGSRKPCRIAQDEIKAGKVKWLIPEIPKLPVVAASETLNKVFAEDA